MSDLGDFYARSYELPPGVTFWLNGEGPFVTVKPPSEAAARMRAARALIGWRK